MNKLFGAAAAAALVLLAPAAFADPGHMNALGKPGEAKNVTRTIKVSMNDEMRYLPASIQVKRNETIRFIVKNVGQMKHEMVLGLDKDLKAHAAQMQKHPEMEHDDPNSVAVEPGKTGEMIWQFTRAGNFKFACLQPGHFEAGMVGKVTVQQAAK